MRRSVVVIVPSLVPTGPIKGAIALCNALVRYEKTLLVCLKPGPGPATEINPNVRVVTLAGIRGGWRGKKRRLKNLLSDLGGRSWVVSMSSCFSADALNSMMARYAHTVASVRGNLKKNYRYYYGTAGVVLAWIHYGILSRFQAVVALSPEMATQLKKSGVGHLNVIGNFVDEQYLERFRKKEVLGGEETRFLFLGSMCFRKRPDLLVWSIVALLRKGIPCRLDLVGDGPLLSSTAAYVQDKRYSDKIIFHGYIENPYEMLQKADYMVLPSMSEGISRAVLESLYFGIPCIVRNVDANRDLILHGKNGFLFETDNELVRVLRLAAAKRNLRQGLKKENLLPKSFHQSICMKRYFELIDRVFDKE